jgi:pimeloyl-ACP methyl ester carboxylesterase
VLAYRVTGDEDDPLVVGLHDGPDGDSELLGRGLADLDDDFRFVTYDRRGQGRSRVDGAPEAWDGWSLEREAADLEALRRHLKADRLSLVAHGFGAAVAIQYGALYPERVERLVLLNAPYPVAATLRGVDERIRARLSGPALETVRWLEGRAGYFPRGVYEQRWGYYAFPAFFHDPDRANRYRPPAFDAVLRREILTRAATLNLEDAIVTIPRPLLVVLSDDDLHPAEQQARWRRLASLVPGGGRLVTLSGAGHYLFLEKQKETLRLVSDFLEGDD